MIRIKTKLSLVLYHITIMIIALGVLIVSACDNTTEDASIDQLVTEMNQRIEIISRSNSVNNVIPRFNQAKSLGCFDASFRVHDEIDSELKQGVFANPNTYQAKLRFANASTQDDSKKDLRGLSIKLFGIEEKPLWGETGTQDFLLNSYPALFVATPEDFLAFIKARQEDKKISFFISPFNSHLKSLWILLKARKKHNSPFDIRYWSTTPFKLGNSDATAVKYSVTPCSEYQTKKAIEPGSNQLRAAVKAHLNQTSACFEFGVQKRNKPDAMPIEDASVIWDEDESPFLTVATITINKQQFDTPESLADCEKMSFNPWQSLAVHQPLGRMNEVRRETYSNASILRNTETP